MKLLEQVPSFQPKDMTEIRYIKAIRRDIDRVFSLNSRDLMDKNIIAAQSEYLENYFPLEKYNNQERCTIHGIKPDRKVIVSLLPCGHYHNCEVCMTGKKTLKLSL